MSYLQSPLGYVVGFDLLIGALMLRYLWLLRKTDAQVAIPISAWIIPVLVNLSGLFCKTDIEEGIAIYGGAAMILVLLRPISDLGDRLLRRLQKSI